MSIIESNVYGLWAADQSAKGTVATTSDVKLPMIGGDVDVNRDDATQQFSDGDRFGDVVEWVNTIIGGGSPVIMATPEELPYLLWLFFGSETHSGTGPHVHVFTPGSSGGKWVTFWQRVGLSTVVRQRFADCRISSVRIEGSTASKLVRVTPNIISLDPAEKVAADPSSTYAKGTAGTANDNLPWIYTEAAGRFTVNGTVFRGHTQFAVVIDDGLTPAYGDDAVPYELYPGAANVRLEGLTMILDSSSLALYNSIIYGTATPADGTKPIRSLAGTTPGSWEADFQRNDPGDAATALQRLKIEVPSIRWAPDVSIAPNVEGGVLELPLAGTARKNGTDPLVRITCNNGSAAYA